MAGYLAFIEEIKHAFPDAVCFDWTNISLPQFCFYGSTRSVLDNVRIYKDYIVFHRTQQTIIDTIINITNCTSWIIWDGKNHDCHGEHFKFDRFYVMFYDKSNIKNYMIYNSIKSYLVINDICADAHFKKLEGVEKLREQISCLDFRPKKEIPYKPVFLD